MWAHESRADLGPLRFSTHERNGVGLESVLRENFSLTFSLLKFSATIVFLIAVGLFYLWLRDGRP